MVASGGSVGVLEPVKEDAPKATNGDKKDGKRVSEKESFPMELGTYAGTKIPFAVLCMSNVAAYMSTKNLKPDPRMDGWFLMDRCPETLILVIFYILFSVVWGPNLMRHREPFKIRKVMMFYNAFQVIYCFVMFLEVGTIAWWWDYSLYCQPVDFSWDDKPLRMTRVAYFFFFSKILDFIDTMFFILNKKFTHISVLHVVHHSTMVSSMWWGVRYTPGGHMTFMGYVNGIIHMFMYSYYFLAAMGPSVRKYLWWKKYLTTMQLGQFVLVGLHSAQLLFHECPTIPMGFIYWSCVYACIFFYLFYDFYQKEYMKKSISDKKDDVKQSVPIDKSKLVSHTAQNLKRRIDSVLSTTPVE